MRYAVEFLGFNDGLPYAEFETDNLSSAKKEIQERRNHHKRVGYRLVQIIEEYEPLENYNPFAK